MQAPWNARVVGPAGAAAVVAGSMLGIGIFLTPPLVAAAVPGPLVFVGFWLAGAVVALCGASAYAELGALLPHAGGDYVFLREAYGPSWAFGAGLVVFALAFAGSIAALADAVAQYQLQALLTAAGTGIDLTVPVAGALTGHQVAAVGLVIGITALNTLGARTSVAAQVVLTGVPLALLAIVAGFALWVAPVPPDAPLPASGEYSAAWQAVYFTYAGWPAVVYLAGEVRDPGRTLPLGMLGGVAVVTALYLLLCAAFVVVLGLPGLAEAGEAGSALAAAVGGPGLSLAVTVLIAMALLASINGTVLGGGRVGFAMARDGSLPAVLARGSRRAPTAALWVQAALASGLLLTGGFAAMVAVSSLAMMVAGSLAVAAVYVLRRRWPRRERRFRAFGYPWSPALYILTSVVALVMSVVEAGTDGDLALSLSGLVVLVVGAAAHRARLVRARTPPPPG